MYVGRASFKVHDKVDNFFFYQNDVAMVSFVEGSKNKTIQILVFNEKELRSYFDNGTTEYPPKVNVICTKS